MTGQPRTAAVLLAGGSGTRVGSDRNKVLLALAGQPVLAHSLATAAALPGLAELVVVVRPDDEAEVRALVVTRAISVPTQVVHGGASRHASEWHALQALASRIEAGEVDVVAVHDSARPLATPDLWTRVVTAAAEHGGALPTRPTAGVVRRDGRLAPRGGLVAVQTPQAFRARDLLAAYRTADADGFEGTDTAACVAAYTDLEVRAVPSSAENLKITFAADLLVAETLLARR